MKASPQKHDILRLSLVAVLFVLICAAFQHSGIPDIITRQRAEELMLEIEHLDRGLYQLSITDPLSNEYQRQNSVPIEHVHEIYELHLEELKELYNTFPDQHRYHTLVSQALHKRVRTQAALISLQDQIRVSHQDLLNDIDALDVSSVSPTVLHQIIYEEGHLKDTKAHHKFSLQKIYESDNERVIQIALELELLVFYYAERQKLLQRQSQHSLATAGEAANQAMARTLAKQTVHSEIIRLVLFVVLLGILVGTAELIYRQQRFNKTLTEAVDERTRELSIAMGALSEAHKKAKEGLRTKSDFLANMSHEIRTPMTAILGYSDLLLSDDLDNESRLEHVDTIRRNGQHLLTIINDILDLSKIEAGKMGVDIQPTSLVGVLLDVHTLMKTRAEEKGLTLNLIYQTPIPAVIPSDDTRLSQILINLIGNAIKFTARGHVSILVSLDEPAPELLQLHIDIADTGKGIDPKTIDSLFQPFSQEDASITRTYGGTGLGLTISRHLAKLLHGKISCTSQPGQGSTFSLTFDLSPGILDETDVILPNTAQKPARTPKPAPAKPTHTPAANEKILLVEDSIDNQRLLCFHLKKAGYTVELAENGQQGIDAWHASLESGSPFVLILMDMQMPVLDGYSAASTLREEGHEIPIIALTAHAMKGDRQKCLDAGCNDYLTKPIDRQALLSLCRQWINGQPEEAPHHPSQRA